MLPSATLPRLLCLICLTLVIYLLFFLFGLSFYPDYRPISPKVTHQSRLLPHYYWKHRSSNPDSYTRESCTEFPREEDIHYAAAHWQHMKLGNGSLYLYGAFWDNRFDEPLVRVLVYADVLPLPNIYCQLWYLHETAPHTVLAEPLYGWRPEWGGPTRGINEPYILACRATFHHHHPHARDAPALAVSLVTEPCERATNVLNVQGAPTPEENLAPSKNIPSESVAACLKWIEYEEDISAQLVEWLQLLKYFQTDVVYIYVARAHQNVWRVLDYYSRQGFVHVTEVAHPPWLSPGTNEKGRRYGQGERDFHDFRRELLPYNDCLYRSMQSHHWLAAFDMDEIIVPVRDGTYPKLLSRESSLGSFDALVCRNVYFLDAAQRNVGAPAFARMLGHHWRAREPTGPGLQVKSLHNTRTVVAMHNHLPMSCGTRGCVNREANVTEARLQHYRNHCPSPPKSDACKSLTEDVIEDTSLERYRWNLLADIPRVLIELGIPLPA